MLRVGMLTRSDEARRHHSGNEPKMRPPARRRRPTRRRHGALACWERARIAGEQRPRVRAEAARASRGRAGEQRPRRRPARTRPPLLPAVRHPPPTRAQSLVLRGSRRGRHRRRPVDAVARVRALDIPPRRQSHSRRRRRSRAEWRWVWGGGGGGAARRVARSAERGRGAGGERAHAMRNFFSARARSRKTTSKNTRSGAAEQGFRLAAPRVRPRRAATARARARYGAHPN